MSAGLATDLSPAPLLDAIENYRGSFIDQDRATVVDAAAFARGRSALTTELPQQGLEAGDRVIVAVGNGPQFPAVLGALLENGASPLLVHWQTPPQELLRTARQFGARFVVGNGERQDALSGVGGHCDLLSADPWLNLCWAHVDVNSPLFNDRLPALPGVPLHPTSGTTGRPKIAARPGLCAVQEARHYIERIGIDDTDTILAAPPMSHAYAYGMCVIVPLLSGANVVCMRAFKPQLALQAMRQFGITIFPAVPVMLDMLMFGAPDDVPCPRRAVLSAGSPLPARTAGRFKKTFSVDVRPLYGTTETGGITVGFDDGRIRCDGAVGTVLSGVEAEVRPHSGAADVGEGAGMLFVRSSSMMAGYLDEDGIDASPLVEGWFQTGDLARVEQNGEIRLLGRDTEVINVSGMKVVPIEVEQVVASLPGVVEVKVYPGQRKSGDQFVQAAVVAESGVTMQAIRDYCAEHLIYYKRPERLHPVDSLPRSPAGKVLVQQLP